MLIHHDVMSYSHLFAVKYFVISSSFLQKMFSLKVMFNFFLKIEFSFRDHLAVFVYFVFLTQFRALFAAYSSRLAPERHLAVRLAPLFLFQHQRRSSRMRVCLEIRNKSNRHVADTHQPIAPHLIMRFWLWHDCMLENLARFAKAPTRNWKIRQYFVSLRGELLVRLIFLLCLKFI